MSCGRGLISDKRCAILSLDTSSSVRGRHIDEIYRTRPKHGVRRNRIIDVYQDWSGPCKAVAGLFRRLKTELNDDLLHFAVANLKAKYGQDTLKNAIHAADSKEEAAKELAFFYPNFVPPTVLVRRVRTAAEATEATSMADSSMRPSQYLGFGPTPPGIQRTVALLRPKAYELYKEEILEKIKEAGFVVAMQKEIQLTKEQAEEYYSEHRGETYFGELTTVMSSGPILALLLARQDAVQTWRNMLGPTDVETARSEAPESLRARFASDEIGIEEEIDGEVHIKPMNLLHGSSDPEEVERDMNFFFPVERTLAAIKPDAYANRDEIIERIKEAGFHVAARKDTQLTPEIAKQLYADIESRPFYEDLINHMTSGRTLFMVLTRQDAVAGWRNLMGPTDPDKAAEENPDSIRATYGRSVLENAVHGSSNTEHASKTIELIFGDANIGLPGHEAEHAVNVEDEGKPAEEGGAEAAAENKEETDGAAPAATDAVDSAPAPEATAAAEGKEAAPGEQPAAEQQEATEEATAEAQPQPDAEAEAPPEAEKQPEAESAPVAPEEAPAESAAPEEPGEEAAEENQNQSANSNSRARSGIGSASSSNSGVPYHSRSGDTTPKPKSARSSDSSDSKVVSYTSVETVSCQCTPYFRTGKRRKSQTDRTVVTRQRVGIDVEPAQHK
ncbi:unnamed protein product [Echinostoma caproni]|uniref:Nucleoside diphosphate kinase n=1 Tax=Echinostoma caproni TaxID=27848 RepID=A0A183A9S4_9TREM|nr:unnamed protein product [Echinostoma caproni]